MSIRLGIMNFIMVLDLVFIQLILYLDLYTDLNRILFLREIVFDNEWFAPISFLKRTIVIIVRYIYDKMKWSQKIQGIPRFRIYLLLDMTLCSYFQHLKITVIENERFAVIMCLKITIVCAIRYTYDQIKLSKNIPRDSPF